MRQRSSGWFWVAVLGLLYLVFFLGVQIGIASGRAQERADIASKYRLR